MEISNNQSLNLQPETSPAISTPNDLNNWLKLGLFGFVALVVIGGVAFFEIRTKMNQTSNSSDSQITLAPTLSQTRPAQIKTPQNNPPAVFVPAKVVEVPVNWNKRMYPPVNLSFYAPVEFSSNFQYFADESAYVIKFWQGDSPDLSLIDFKIQDVKNNFSTQKDAKDAKDFKISDSLKAIKIDPPQVNKAKLSSYKTYYYFEKSDKAYSLICDHGWIQSNYDMCESILKTIEFN